MRVNKRTAHNIGICIKFYSISSTLALTCQSSCSPPPPPTHTHSLRRIVPTLICTRLATAGLHLTTLKVYLDDGSSYELSRSLYSHYVRRSIKRLTVDEKDHFFDAFLAMYRFNTSAGQHMFGGHFRGLRDFVGAHLAAAGTRNADRFHDGMGFVTQHAALTNEFELSMQSMYPSMAMPFWDYTEDGEVGSLGLCSAIDSTHPTTSSTTLLGTPSHQNRAISLSPTAPTAPIKPSLYHPHRPRTSLSLFLSLPPL